MRIYIYLHLSNTSTFSTFFFYFLVFIKNWDSYICSSKETQFSFSIVYRAVDTFSNLKKARTVRPKSHDDVIYLNSYTGILVIGNFFKLSYWCTYIM